MEGIYGDSRYVSNSIGVSRTFQENFAAANGVTVYGKIASLISSNTERIDRIAEYLGTIYAQNDVNRMYTEQYGKNKIFGGIKRTLTTSDKAWDKQVERRNHGFIKGFVVEGGIKLLSRGIQKWTSEREKYNCFEQMYRILLAYANEDRNNLSAKNIQLEIKELNKIRNSFPLSNDGRMRLIDISVENLDIFESEFTIFNLNESGTIKENLAYFLYVLYACKYGDTVENEDRLLQYYNLLGYGNIEGKEILRENKDIYDTVIDEQLKYLMLSRAMLKNLEPSMPQIDVNQLKIRIDEMAKNDPYRIRKKMVLKPSINHPKNIVDLFFDEPMIALQAGATAISQLNMNDDIKEDTRRTMVNKWGFDSSVHDSIILEADDIKNETNKIVGCG